MQATGARPLRSNPPLPMSAAGPITALDLKTSDSGYLGRAGAAADGVLLGRGCAAPLGPYQLCEAAYCTPTARN